VKNCTTARDVWEILREVNTNIGTLNMVTTMLEELCTFKKPESMSKRAYMEKIETWCDNIVQGGFEISEQRRAAFMLRGLPKERFELLIRCLEQEETRFTLRSVKATLILEEKREKLDETKEKNKEEAKALRSSTVRCEEKKSHPTSGGYKEKQSDNRSYPSSGGPRERQGTREPVPCFVCKEVGHKSMTCPKNRGAGPMVCFMCHKENHIARFCPELKRGEPVRAKGQRVVGDAESDNPPTVTVRAKALHVRVRKVHQERGGKTDPHTWRLDSGATQNICPFRELFDSYQECTSGTAISSTGEVAKIAGQGTVPMKANDEYGGWTFTLNDVLHVPDMLENLLSVRLLDKKGAEVTVKKNAATVKCSDGDTVLIVPATGDDYIFKTGWYELDKDMVAELQDRDMKEEQLRRVTTAATWHQRIGHTLNLPECLPKLKGEDCEVCFKGKLKRKRFSPRKVRSEHAGDLIFSDVCQVSTESLGGAKYFVTWTDDYTRYSFVVPIKHKNDELETFKKMKPVIERELGAKIKAHQSDNGGEYTSNEFKQYLLDQGIAQRFSRPFSPESMGVAERLNRQLLATTRCILIQAQMPGKFWAGAVSTACYVKNKCASSTLGGKAPYGLVHGRDLEEKDLQNCGCSEARCGHIIGLVTSSMRGRRSAFSWGTPRTPADTDWDVKNKEVIISRDVVCVEEKFPMGSGTENMPTTEEVDLGNECEVGVESDGEPYDVDSDGDSSGDESEREDDSSDTEVDEESGEGVNAEVRAEGDNAEGRAEGGIAVVQAPGPEAAMALPDAAGGAEPEPGDEDVGDHGGECGEPL